MSGRLSPRLRAMALVMVALRALIGAYLVRGAVVALALGTTAYPRPAGVLLAALLVAAVALYAWPRSVLAGAVLLGAACAAWQARAPELGVAPPLALGAALALIAVLALREWLAARLLRGGDDATRP